MNHSHCHPRLLLALSSIGGLVLALFLPACRVPSAPLSASWPARSSGAPVQPVGVNPAWSSEHLVFPGELDLDNEPTDPILEHPAAEVRMAAASSEKEDEGYAWKSFTLSLGGQLLATINTTLRVDSPTAGVGTEIDLEDDFDTDDSLFAGRIDAEWRMAKRHALDFSLYDLRRKGTRVIDRNIQIGDTVFPVNTSVTNEFETLVVKLAYRYSFLHRTRWHAGASFGLHTMNWKTEWKASGAGLEEDFDFTAPLPVLGIFGSYALSPKLYLNAASEFFALEFEEFEGFLNNTRLTLEHRTFEHVGFGVGLDYFLINASLENESGSLQAEAEYDYLSAMGFVRIF